MHTDTVYLPLERIVTDHGESVLYIYHQRSFPVNSIVIKYKLNK